MKCKYCDNEVPDNTLICMYCGRIVQTEQERDERIRKRKDLRSCLFCWRL